MGLIVVSNNLVAQCPIPQDTSYTAHGVYQKIKADFPYTVPAKDTLPSGIKAFRNLAYLSLKDSLYGKRSLKVDIFRPDIKGKIPAVLMVHGGGWRSGDKSMQIPMAQKLAERGFVAIPVDYQKSLEAKYPAALHNLKAAIRWLKANAETYGIDTAKIAISGCSAGGQLAALVAQTNDVAEMEGNLGGFLNYSSRVHAAIDVDGVVSFLAPLSLNLKRKPDAADVAWLGGAYSEIPEIWRQASAGYWVNERSVPMLFINSGFPRFHAGQDELIGQYKEYGIYQEVHKVDVKVHPFWLFYPWVDETVNYMVNFLDKVFLR